MNLIQNIINSFKKGESGLSARKCTAFVLTCLIVYLNIYHVDSTNVIYVLIIDSLLLLLLLGLVTFQQVIEFKDGIKPPTV